MVTIELKSKIIEKLKNFPEQNLYSGATDLFSLLGYNTERNPGENNLSPEDFLESYDQQEIFNRGKGEVSEWKSVSVLFQLTDGEITFQTRDMFDTGELDRDIPSYFFIAVDLAGENYSRTRLGNITREINKLFGMPVLVLFRHGGYITLSIIYRRVNLRDGDKDVLQKVTLIKDIRLDTPHRAHTEILFDFSFTSIAEKFAPDSFISLDNAWRKVLDTKELNKKFFKSLANWYFFAQDKVKFPNDLEQEEPGYSQLSLIRLITRLIFVWFIREKNLINPDLFKPDKLKNIIKDFNKSPGSNNYYRAILQNLFFATLNKSANEREFIKDGDFNTNRDQYGVKNLYRYKSLFQTDEITALELFNDTPFLNGGLFECLDIEQEDKKVKYVDGFSRNPAKMANVPDSLFFGEFDNVDLSTFYDDKKRKKEGVSGLITLFENYKFTVEENTPVEEEVALDPELLGKVFENLLANYNPETKTTARKQTGSFYTPREIVNYMVDESLIAYLKQKLGEKISGYSKLGADTIELAGNDTRAGQLEIESAESGSGWDGKEEELEAELRSLLSYNEYNSRFSEEEKKLLVEAVHECKILDPACGSGAFPMGVLQKLVHLLTRLDSNNNYWKELQIAKASADTKDAYSNIEEQQERNKRIDEIQENFDESINNPDYARKLYLIENCIYGVDIQPIAVQIAKLRFFISLVIEQKDNKEKPNRGIRPLPNLETKIVAANTLIGLEKPEQMVLRNPEIDRLEEEIKETRRKHFNATNRADKQKHRKDDKKLREVLGNLLKDDGWKQDVAKQLQEWDPYDQNLHAEWFDAEWMFGITNGFDIVIGNPPYLFTRGTDFSDEFKKYIKDQYFSLLEKDKIKSKANQAGKINLFFIFIMKAGMLAKAFGRVQFIIPNTFLRITIADKIRKYLLQNYSFAEIVDLGAGVFSEVTASTILLSFDNSKSNRKTRIITSVEDLGSRSFRLVHRNSNNFVRNVCSIINIYLHDKELFLSQKISKGNNILDQYCLEIIAGIDAPKHLIFNVKNHGEMPLLEGKNIKQYFISNPHHFLKWKPEEINRTSVASLRTSDY